MLQAALKIRPVGKHADARRPVLLVDLRDLYGIEIGADNSRRRAGLFHLGDQADGRPLRQCAEKIARRRGSGRLLAQFLHGRIGLGQIDLLALGCHDVVENSGHLIFGITACKPPV